MTVYITKVWGFSEPASPLQFNSPGWRDSARAKLQSGDLVVLVGTKGKETAEDMRGRVLAVMEPTTELVLTMDFELEHRENDFDEDGNYRWPYGLLNRRAWELLDRPLLTEISNRTFSMDSACGIVPLTEEEAAKILQLEKKEVTLAGSVRSRARFEGAEAARRHGAPPPTTTRTGVMHMRRAPAYTYLMVLEGAKPVSIKIGWAFDYKKRLRQFNHASLPAVGGLNYDARLFFLWDTARQAFNMEQALLNQFKAHRHRDNQEIICGIPFKDLEREWIAFLQKMQVL